jgi:hypothetical protein
MRVKFGNSPRLHGNPRQVVLPEMQGTMSHLSANVVSQALEARCYSRFFRAGRLTSEFDWTASFQPSTLDSKTQENLMRSRWLLASALAGCFVLGWGAHAVTAQRRTPVSVTRLYTGSDGETHAEEIADTRLTPDAARSGLEASDVIRVSGLQFARTAPGWVRDWHVAERHQYIVTLSGRGEIELAGGRKVPLEPGSVILAEDSTGKGHISRTLGTEDRIALNI